MMMTSANIHILDSVLDPQKKTRMRVHAVYGGRKQIKCSCACVRARTSARSTLTLLHVENLALD